MRDTYNTEAVKTRLEANGGVVALPDFRGMFLRGEGTARINGELKSQHASAELGNAQGAALLDHLHHILHMDTYLDVSRPGDKDRRVPEGGTYTVRNVDRPLKSELRGGGSETRPVNYAVHWIIRVK